MNIYLPRATKNTWRLTNAFKVGLTIRAICILFFVPLIQDRWFINFVLSWLYHPTVDPWSHYLSLMGSQKAFPYGFAMLFGHAPTVAIGAGLDAIFDLTRRFAAVGFGISILAADISLYFILVRWVGRSNQKNVDVFYWLSPLTIYVCYIHGQTDIIPVILLFSSIYFLEKQHFKKSGILLGLSVSAKLSMLLIVPFLFMHVFLKNKRLAEGRASFTMAFLFGSMLTLLGLLTPGGRMMILGNTELLSSLQLGIFFSDYKSILIFPFCYFILLFSSWLLAPLSKNSLEGFIAISFCVILLTTSSPVGWYLWLVPALTLYSIHASQFGKASILLLYSTIVIQSALHNETFMYVGSNLDIGQYLVSSYLKEVSPLGLPLNTALLATFASALMAVLAYRIYYRMILNSWFFKLTRKPVVIGLAGDSGSGKDTLANALSDAIGCLRVSQVLGDDYHRYPRKGRVWTALTHLDPRANDLAAMTDDVLKLARGESSFVAHYDHDTGLFTNRRKVNSNEFIIVNGLHALYPQALTDRYNLSIYLDMNEDLRNVLKAARDSVKRGVTLDQVRMNMAKRAPDGERFIKPQKTRADVVLSLQPMLPLPATTDDVPLQLLIQTGLDVDIEKFCQELLAIAQIPSSIEETFGKREITIYDGFDSKFDAQACAERILSGAIELTAIHPEWKEGMLGVMQVFVIYALHSKVVKSVNIEVN